VNIFVFVKRVPDSESKIRIDHENNRIVEDDLNFVLNPYDEFAVEEALQIKENQGGKVTALSVGPDEAVPTLKKALAMGVDEAVLIKDDTPEQYDGLRVARIIAHTLQTKYQEFDLLLFGKQSIGDDNAQVPGMVAAMLDLPQVSVVTKLEWDGLKGTAQREIEGATEKIAFSLPAVISAQKGLNEPRYETLKGIMMAKRKEVPVVTLEDLGLDPDELNPALELTKMEAPPEREAGKKIEEEPAEAARQLVHFLHDEAKII
jgi:electron transfer flavoprotein beta subunit